MKEFPQPAEYARGRVGGCMIDVDVPRHEQALEKLDNVCASTEAQFGRVGAGVCPRTVVVVVVVVTVVYYLVCVSAWLLTAQLTGRDKKGDGHETVHDHYELPHSVEIGCESTLHGVCNRVGWKAFTAGKSGARASTCLCLRRTPSTE